MHAVAAGFLNEGVIRELFPQHGDENVHGATAGTGVDGQGTVTNLKGEGGAAGKGIALFPRCVALGDGGGSGDEQGDAGETNNGGRAHAETIRVTGAAGSGFFSEFTVRGNFAGTAPLAPGEKVLDVVPLRGYTSLIG